MTRHFSAICILVLFSFLSNALTSYSDLSGHQAKTTGNNPHGWNARTLTNIVQLASDVPEQMVLGVDPNKAFLVGYDFSTSSIDFSNTNRYRAVFCGGDSTNTELYGVGTMSEIGQGSCWFYFGNASLSSPAQVLTNGTPLRLTLVDSSSVYAFDEELRFDAFDPSLGGWFPYSGGLGEKIGTILNKLTVQSAYGTPLPGTVEVFPDTISTQTIESVVSGAPGVRFRNTGSDLTNE